MNLTDLQHYIRVYDDNLEAPLCRQMVESFAALARFQQRNGRGVRKGLEDSAWTELNVTSLSDKAFIQLFRMRIDTAVQRYNSDVGLTIPLPSAEKTADLMMKRYRPSMEERFQVHFDAVNQYASRYLVLLWYLNDVAEGGETRFPQLDYAVAPRVGRLLMFPPYWMYQHEGRPPVSGDKYIVSTYLLFTSAPSAPQTL
ncbi:MAG TPA: 2OG-Fe(II) oxygenase [Steroidobacteraceae bacterium]